MTLAFRYAARTHVGIVREKNDDSGYAGPNLLVVADGMGGVAGGDVASAITVDVLRSLDRPQHADPESDLDAAASDANARIARRGRTEPRYDGMGTTLTAGILHDGNRLTLGHIGDSRAYLLRGDEMVMLTKDHTFVQRLVDEGRITEAQARVHPHRALIIRVLDGNPENRPDFYDISLEAGDRLLFCSDGVEDVREEHVFETLRDNPDPGLAAELLISLALRSGSSDNVTCVVADVVPAGQQNGMAVQVVGAAEIVDLEADAAVESTAMQAPIDDAEPVLGEDPRPPEQAITHALAAGDPPPGTAMVRLEDPEDLRYAPRAPSRFRWPIRILAIAALLGVFVGGGYLAYDWTQQQYYIGTADVDGNEQVAIYQGIDQSVPVIDLSSVVQTSQVAVAALPTADRARVRAHIPAQNLDQARSTLADLQQTADDCDPRSEAANPDDGSVRECDGASAEGSTPGSR